MSTKKIRTLVAATAGAIVATPLFIAPAIADDGKTSEPTPKAAECNTWKSDSGKTGYAKCWNMSINNRMQVKVTCIGPNGNQWIEYGNGVGNDTTSSETCQGTSVGVYKVGTYFTSIGG